MFINEHENIMISVKHGRRISKNSLLLAGEHLRLCEEQQWQVLGSEQKE